MSTLRVDEVTQLFRSTSRGGGLTPALRKVSFDIAQGEVVTLIGESGSGKSTLGKVILRLLRPTSGKVTFGGTDIGSYRQRGLRDYYRQVQGVFQDPFSSYNPIYPADRVFALATGATATIAGVKVTALGEVAPLGSFPFAQAATAVRAALTAELKDDAFATWLRRRENQSLPRLACTHDETPQPAAIDLTDWAPYLALG